MKKIRIFALVLTVLVILPLMFACGNKKKGDPYTFTSFSVSTTVDPNAKEGEAPDKDFDGEIYNGEAVVYTEDPTTITVKDVIIAYCDAQNVAYVYDENTNQFTKIDDLSAGGNYFWNITVNGQDKGLATVVSTEDEIAIIYTK